MEEDEVLGVVRHSFECDLGICVGRQNVNHIHSQGCRASTGGHDKIDSPSGSNDGMDADLFSEGISIGFSHKVGRI